MARGICASLSIDNLLSSTNLPNIAEIMMVPLPPKFKAQQIKLYDKPQDPVEHMEMFKAHMTLYGFSREITCWAFPLTLKVVVRVWFGAKQLGSIDNFEELERQFLTQFMASRRRKWLTMYLILVKLQDNESLKAYLARFNKECIGQMIRTRRSCSWHS